MLRATVADMLDYFLDCEALVRISTSVALNRPDLNRIDSLVDLNTNSSVLFCFVQEI